MWGGGGTDDDDGMMMMMMLMMRIRISSCTWSIYGETQISLKELPAPPYYPITVCSGSRFCMSSLAGYKLETSSMPLTMPCYRPISPSKTV